MKIISLCVICICLASNLIEIVECRSIRTDTVLGKSEKTGPIRTEFMKVQSLLGFVGQDAMKHVLELGGCKEHVIDTVIGDWQTCINLTLDLAELQEELGDWFEYRYVVTNLTLNFFRNITSCKIRNVLEETICVSEAFLAVIPDYQDALVTYIKLLKETDKVVDSIKDDFLQCILRKKDIMIKLENSCSNIKLINMLKTLYLKNGKINYF